MKANHVMTGSSTPYHRPTIVHVLHSLEGGGTERTLAALLHAWPSNTFRHVVVTLRHAGALTTELPDGVACRPLGLKGRVPTAGFRLARVLRSCKASVVHARNTGCWNDATLAAILSPRVKLVLGFHGLEHDRGFDRRRIRSIRLALWAGAHFTSVSRCGRDQLQREAGVDAQRISLLPNGVDLNRFAPATPTDRRRIRESFGLDDRAFVVGIVGSLTPVKDHANLFKAAAIAMRNIPNLRLLIVGQGRLRAELERQAVVEAGDIVRFLGAREDIPDVLNALDAYVCCSKSEGMNNALLEAMATGVPVIVTNAGDNTHIVRDDIDGITIEAGDAPALADRIGRLHGNPSRRRLLAQAALARAQQFSFDRTVHAYARFYQTLTPEKHRPTTARPLAEPV